MENDFFAWLSGKLQCSGHSSTPYCSLSIIWPLPLLDLGASVLHCANETMQMHREAQLPTCKEDSADFDFRHRHTGMHDIRGVTDSVPLLMYVTVKVG